MFSNFEFPRPTGYSLFRGLLNNYSLYQGRVVKSVNVLRRDLLQKHYNDYTPRQAKIIATLIKRSINVTRCNNRQCSDFLNKSRRLIYFCHEFNTQVAKLSGTYPSSRELHQLLTRYIHLEYEVLSKSKYSRSNEVEVEQRVFRLLVTLLSSSPNHSHGTITNDTYNKQCYIEALRILVNYIKYNSREVPFVNNIVLNLLNRLGYIKTPSQPDGESYLDIQLLELQKILETKDYDSNEDVSDDDFEQSICDPPPVPIQTTRPPAREPVKNENNYLDSHSRPSGEEIIYIDVIHSDDDFDDAICMSFASKTTNSSDQINTGYTLRQIENRNSTSLNRSLSSDEFENFDSVPSSALHNSVPSDVKCEINNSTNFSNPPNIDNLVISDDDNNIVSSRSCSVNELIRKPYPFDLNVQNKLAPTSHLFPNDNANNNKAATANPTSKQNEPVKCGKATNEITRFTSSNSYNERTRCFLNNCQNIVLTDSDEDSPEEQQMFPSRRSSNLSRSKSREERISVRKLENKPDRFTWVPGKSYENLEEINILSDDEDVSCSVVIRKKEVDVESASAQSTTDALERRISVISDSRLFPSGIVHTFSPAQTSRTKTTHTKDKNVSYKKRSFKPKLFAESDSKAKRISYRKLFPPIVRKRVRFDNNTPADEDDEAEPVLSEEIAKKLEAYFPNKEQIPDIFREHCNPIKTRRRVVREKNLVDNTGSKLTCANKLVNQTTVNDGDGVVTEVPAQCLDLSVKRRIHAAAEDEVGRNVKGNEKLSSTVDATRNDDQSSSKRADNSVGENPMNFQTGTAEPINLVLKEIEINTGGSASNVEITSGIMRNDVFKINDASSFTVREDGNNGQPPGKTTSDLVSSNNCQPSDAILNLTVVKTDGESNGDLEVGKKNGGRGGGKTDSTPIDHLKSAEIPIAVTENLEIETRAGPSAVANANAKVTTKFDDANGKRGTVRENVAEVLSGLAVNLTANVFSEDPKILKNNVDVEKLVIKSAERSPLIIDAKRTSIGASNPIPEAPLELDFMQHPFEERQPEITKSTATSGTTSNLENHESNIVPQNSNINAYRSDSATMKEQDNGKTNVSNVQRPHEFDSSSKSNEARTETTEGEKKEKRPNVAVTERETNESSVKKSSDVQSKNVNTKTSVAESAKQIDKNIIPDDELENVCTEKTDNARIKEKDGQKERIVLPVPEPPEFDTMKTVCTSESTKMDKTSSTTTEDVSKGIEKQGGIVRTKTLFLTESKYFNLARTSDPSNDDVQDENGENNIDDDHETEIDNKPTEKSNSSMMETLEEKSTDDTLLDEEFDISNFEEISTLNNPNIDSQDDVIIETIDPEFNNSNDLRTVDTYHSLKTENPENQDDFTNKTSLVANLPNYTENDNVVNEVIDSTVTKTISVPNSKSHEETNLDDISSVTLPNTSINDCNESLGEDRESIPIQNDLPPTPIRDNRNECDGDSSSKLIEQQVIRSFSVAKVSETVVVPQVYPADAACILPRSSLLKKTENQVELLSKIMEGEQNRKNVNHSDLLGLETDVQAEGVVREEHASEPKVVQAYNDIEDHTNLHLLVDQACKEALLVKSNGIQNNEIPETSQNKKYFKRSRKKMIMAEDKIAENKWQLETTGKDLVNLNTRLTRSSKLLSDKADNISKYNKPSDFKTGNLNQCMFKKELFNHKEGYQTCGEDSGDSNHGGLLIDENIETSKPDTDLGNEKLVVEQLDYHSSEEATVCISIPEIPGDYHNTKDNLIQEIDDIIDPKPSSLYTYLDESAFDVSKYVVNDITIEKSGTVSSNVVCPETVKPKTDFTIQSILGPNLFQDRSHSSSVVLAYPGLKHSSKEPVKEKISIETTVTDDSIIIGKAEDKSHIITAEKLSDPKDPYVRLQKLIEDGDAGNIYALNKLRSKSCEMMPLKKDYKRRLSVGTKTVPDNLLLKNERNEELPSEHAENDISDNDDEASEKIDKTPSKHLNVRKNGKKNVKKSKSRKPKKSNPTKRERKGKQNYSQHPANQQGWSNTIKESNSILQTDQIDSEDELPLFVRIEKLKEIGSSNKTKERPSTLKTSRKLKPVRMKFEENTDIKKESEPSLTSKLNESMESPKAVNSLNFKELEDNPKKHKLVHFKKKLILTDQEIRLQSKTKEDSEDDVSITKEHSNIETNIKRSIGVKTKKCGKLNEIDDSIKLMNSASSQPDLRSREKSMVISTSKFKSKPNLSTNRSLIDEAHGLETESCLSNKSSIEEKPKSKVLTSKDGRGRAESTKTIKTKDEQDHEKNYKSKSGQKRSSKLKSIFDEIEEPTNKELVGEKSCSKSLRNKNKFNETVDATDSQDKAEFKNCLTAKEATDSNRKENESDAKKPSPAKLQGRRSRSMSKVDESKSNSSAIPTKELTELKTSNRTIKNKNKIHSAVLEDDKFNIEAVIPNVGKETDEKDSKTDGTISKSTSEIEKLGNNKIDESESIDKKLRIRNEINNTINATELQDTIHNKNKISCFDIISNEINKTEIKRDITDELSPLIQQKPSNSRNRRSKSAPGIDKSVKDFPIYGKKLLKEKFGNKRTRSRKNTDDTKYLDEQMESEDEVTIASLAKETNDSSREKIESNDRLLPLVEQNRSKSAGRSEKASKVEESKNNSAIGVEKKSKILRIGKKIVKKTESKSEASSLNIVEEINDENKKLIKGNMEKLSVSIDLDKLKTNERTSEIGESKNDTSPISIEILIEDKSGNKQKHKTQIDRTTDEDSVKSNLVISSPLTDLKCSKSQVKKSVVDELEMVSPCNTGEPSTEIVVVRNISTNKNELKSEVIISSKKEGDEHADRKLKSMKSLCDSKSKPDIGSDASFTSKENDVHIKTIRNNSDSRIKKQKTEENLPLNSGDFNLKDDDVNENTTIASKSSGKKDKAESVSVIAPVSKRSLRSSTVQKETNNVQLKFDQKEEHLTICNEVKKGENNSLEKSFETNVTFSDVKNIDKEKFSNEEIVPGVKILDTSRANIDLEETSQADSSLQNINLKSKNEILGGIVSSAICQGVSEGEEKVCITKPSTSIEAYKTASNNKLKRVQTEITDHIRTKKPKLIETNEIMLKLNADQTVSDNEAKSKISAIKSNELETEHVDKLENVTPTEKCVNEEPKMSPKKSKKSPISNQLPHGETNMEEIVTHSITMVKRLLQVFPTSEAVKNSSKSIHIVSNLHSGFQNGMLLVPSLSKVPINLNQNGRDNEKEEIKNFSSSAGKKNELQQPTSVDVGRKKVEPTQSTISTEMKCIDALTKESCSKDIVLDSVKMSVSENESCNKKLAGKEKMDLIKSRVNIITNKIEVEDLNPEGTVSELTDIKNTLLKTDSMGGQLLNRRLTRSMASSRSPNRRLENNDTVDEQIGRNLREKSHPFESSSGKIRNQNEKPNSSKAEGSGMDKHNLTCKDDVDKRFPEKQVVTVTNDESCKAVDDLRTVKVVSKNLKLADEKEENIKTTKLKQGDGINLVEKTNVEQFDASKTNINFELDQETVQTKDDKDCLMDEEIVKESFSSGIQDSISSLAENGTNTPNKEKIENDSKRKLITTACLGLQRNSTKSNKNRKLIAICNDLKDRAQKSSAADKQSEDLMDVEKGKICAETESHLNSASLKIDKNSNKKSQLLATKLNANQETIQKSLFAISETGGEAKTKLRIETHSNITESQGTAAPQLNKTTKPDVNEKLQSCPQEIEKSELTSTTIHLEMNEPSLNQNLSKMKVAEDISVLKSFEENGAASYARPLGKVICDALKKKENNDGTLQSGSGLENVDASTNDKENLIAESFVSLETGSKSSDREKNIRKSTIKDIKTKIFDSNPTKELSINVKHHNSKNMEISCKNEEIKVDIPNEPASKCDKLLPTQMTALNVFDIPNEPASKCDKLLPTQMTALNVFVKDVKSPEVKPTKKDTVKSSSKKGKEQKCDDKKSIKEQPKRIQPGNDTENLKITEENPPITVANPETKFVEDTKSQDGGIPKDDKAGIFEKRDMATVSKKSKNVMKPKFSEAIINEEDYESTLFKIEQPIISIHTVTVSENIRQTLEAIQNASRRSSKCKSKTVDGEYNLGTSKTRKNCKSRKSRVQSFQFDDDLQNNVIDSTSFKEEDPNVSSQISSPIPEITLQESKLPQSISKCAEIKPKIITLEDMSSLQSLKKRVKPQNMSKSSVVPLKRESKNVCNKDIDTLELKARQIVSLIPLQKREGNQNVAIKSKETTNLQLKPKEGKRDVPKCIKKQKLRGRIECRVNECGDDLQNNVIDSTSVEEEFHVDKNIGTETFTCMFEDLTAIAAVPNVKRNTVFANKSVLEEVGKVTINDDDKDELVIEVELVARNKNIGILQNNVIKQACKTQSANNFSEPENKNRCSLTKPVEQSTVTKRYKEISKQDNINEKIVPECLLKTTKKANDDHVSKKETKTDLKPAETNQSLNVKILAKVVGATKYGDKDAKVKEVESIIERPNNRIPQKVESHQNNTTNAGSLENLCKLAINHKIDEKSNVKDAIEKAGVHNEGTKRKSLDNESANTVKYPKLDEKSIEFVHLKQKLHDKICWSPKKPHDSLLLRPNFKGTYFNTSRKNIPRSKLIAKIESSKQQQCDENMDVGQIEETTISNTQFNQTFETKSPPGGDIKSPVMTHAISLDKNDLPPKGNQELNETKNDEIKKHKTEAIKVSPTSVVEDNIVCSLKDHGIKEGLEEITRNYESLKSIGQPNVLIGCEALLLREQQSKLKNSEQINTIICEKVCNESSSLCLQCSGALSDNSDEPTLPLNIPDDDKIHVVKTVTKHFKEIVQGGFDENVKPLQKQQLPEFPSHKNSLPLKEPNSDLCFSKVDAHQFCEPLQTALEQMCSNAKDSKLIPEDSISQANTSLLSLKEQQNKCEVSPTLLNQHNLKVMPHFPSKIPIQGNVDIQSSVMGPMKNIMPLDELPLSNIDTLKMVAESCMENITNKSDEFSPEVKKVQVKECDQKLKLVDTGYLPHEHHYHGSRSTVPISSSLSLHDFDRITTTITNISNTKSPYNGNNCQIPPSMTREHNYITRSDQHMCPQLDLNPKCEITTEEAHFIASLSNNPLTVSEANFTTNMLLMNSDPYPNIYSYIDSEVTVDTCNLEDCSTDTAVKSHRGTTSNQENQKNYPFEDLPLTKIMENQLLDVIPMNTSKNSANHRDPIFSVMEDKNYLGVFDHQRLTMNDSSNTNEEKKGNDQSLDQSGNNSANYQNTGTAADTNHRGDPLFSVMEDKNYLGVFDHQTLTMNDSSNTNEEKKDNDQSLDQSGNNNPGKLLDSAEDFYGLEMETFFSIGAQGPEDSFGYIPDADLSFNSSIQTLNLISNLGSNVEHLDLKNNLEVKKTHEAYLDNNLHNINIMPSMVTLDKSEKNKVDLGKSSTKEIIVVSENKKVIVRPAETINDFSYGIYSNLENFSSFKKTTPKINKIVIPKTLFPKRSIRIPISKHAPQKNKIIASCAQDNTVVNNITKKTIEKVSKIVHEKQNDANMDLPKFVKESESKTTQECVKPSNSLVNIAEIYSEIADESNTVHSTPKDEYSKGVVVDSNMVSTNQKSRISNKIDETNKTMSPLKITPETKNIPITQNMFINPTTSGNIPERSKASTREDLKKPSTSSTTSSTSKINNESKLPDISFPQDTVSPKASQNMYDRAKRPRLVVNYDDNALDAFDRIFKLQNTKTSKRRKPPESNWSEEEGNKNKKIKSFSESEPEYRKLHNSSGVIDYKYLDFTIEQVKDKSRRRDPKIEDKKVSYLQEPGRSKANVDNDPYKFRSFTPTPSENQRSRRGSDYNSRTKDFASSCKSEPYDKSRSPSFSNRHTDPHRTQTNKREYPYQTAAGTSEYYNKSRYPDAKKQQQMKEQSRHNYEYLKKLRYRVDALYKVKEKDRQSYEWIEKVNQSMEAGRKLDTKTDLFQPMKRITTTDEVIK